VPTVLSSWKEVANYVGKGVRTVQRWEKDRGLPVRRRADNAAGTILVIPQEIDTWMRSWIVAGQLNADLSSVHQQKLDLQSELEKLRAENEMLSRALRLVLLHQSAEKKR
jgi:hypothetical protein